ncbi:MAG: nucleotidyl transferase AbiEii/AbiGii toxin family protein [Bacteroidetes bacterium]|nr:nucleotidyl transferase AbiEii/AbiGii toxin family protein [Bacteroidota bacterium]
MIKKSEVKDIAQIRGLRPQIVEKNYVLGWVLAGINQHPSLRGKWIFKGGTCLKKCFLETYRFSENLDFTITDPSHLNEDFILETFREVCRWIFHQCRLEFPEHLIQFEFFTNSRGSTSCRGKIAYRGPMGPSIGYRSLPRLKIDLTFDEILVLPPVERKIHHEYSDILPKSTEALCYSIEEIAAEKFCALEQRTNPRDLYDLVNLFRNTELSIDMDILRDVLHKKCVHRNTKIPTLECTVKHSNKFQPSWPHMLSHQLPELPLVGIYLEALPNLFEWIANGANLSILYPITNDGDLFQEQSVNLDIAFSIKKYLEIIRFAGVNHLCVDVHYKQMTYRVEPYSIRSTARNEIIFHAIRTSDATHSIFTVSEIQGATMTQQSFQPRYLVELRPIIFNYDV